MATFDSISLGITAMDISTEEACAQVSIPYIPDDILHTIIPHLDRRTISNLRLLSRRYNALARPILLSKARFPLPRCIEPNTLSPFHPGNGIRRRSWDSMMPEKPKGVEAILGSRQRVETFLGLKPTPLIAEGTANDADDPKIPMMLMPAHYIRELDLTGLLFMQPHSTDAWFSTPRTSFPRLSSLPSLTTALLSADPPQSPRSLTAVMTHLPPHLSTLLLESIPTLPLLNTLKLRSMDLLAIVVLLSHKFPHLRVLDVSQVHAPLHGSTAAHILSKMTPSGFLVTVAGLTDLSTSTCGTNCERCLLPGTVLAEAMGKGLWKLERWRVGDFG
ncbi:hypothetical protein HDU97_007637, partial [Phlyctochytrium planicorne]